MIKQESFRQTFFSIEIKIFVIRGRFLENQKNYEKKL